jgi:hypothetical protein
MRISVEASLRKKPNPISKTARAKKVRGVAKAVEHLASKHKALSSKELFNPKYQ